VFSNGSSYTGELLPQLPDRHPLGIGIEFHWLKLPRSRVTDNHRRRIGGCSTGFTNLIGWAPPRVRRSEMDRGKRRRFVASGLGSCESGPQ
jgi:hypothetical protein